MRANSIILGLLLLAGGPPAWSAPPQDFSRYEIILQRKPFGEFHEPAAKPPPPKPAGPSWDVEFKLISVVSVEDAQPKAGLVHRGTLKPVILSPGQQQDGITLVSINEKEQSALFRKGGVDARFVLGQPGSVQVAAGTEPVAVAGTASTPAGGTAASPRLRRTIPAPPR